MATAESIIIVGDKAPVFASVLRIVNEAGYPIAETDDAAKKIIYFAKRVRNNYHQTREVTISVSGDQAQRTIVSIKALTVNMTRFDAKKNEISFSDELESELIAFAISMLKNQYQFIERPPKNGCYAPGVADVIFSYQETDMTFGHQGSEPRGILEVLGRTMGRGVRRLMLPIFSFCNWCRGK